MVYFIDMGEVNHSTHFVESFVYQVVETFPEFSRKNPSLHRKALSIRHTWRQRNHKTEVLSHTDENITESLLTSLMCWAGWLQQSVTDFVAVHLVDSM